MLSHSKLVAFIITRDAQTSRAFYEGVLGLRFVSDDSFALVFDSGGNMVRIGKFPDFTPAPYTVLGWNVANIDDEFAILTASGVVFEKYPFVEDPRGIWTAPSGDRIAWFKDPDGNVLSISQHV